VVDKVTEVRVPPKVFFCLMLWYLLVGSSSNVFGFDFGSEFVKVSMAKPGKGVHVALNQQSKRLTPSYFAFWNVSNPSLQSHPKHWNVSDLFDCSWLYGEQAKSHSRRFPHNCIKGMTPILEDKHGFKMKEVVALLAKYLISTCDDMKWKPESSSVVFAIEPWMSRKERFGLSEAIKLTGATLFSIVDSPTAASMAYALEKQSFFKQKPKIVAFFDYGAAHSWVSLFRFKTIKGKIISEQLSVSTNFELGGNNIDKILAKNIKEKFISKNGRHDFNERAEMLFVNEGRRVKEILSLNDKVDIHIDDVIGDLGVSYPMNRDEFSTLISCIESQIISLFDESVSTSGISKDEIDSIELLGGSTRIPIVQNIILKWSGMDKLNRTMNSDEAIALGAGYVGASISSAFQIPSVSMSTFSGIDVNMINGNQTYQIFSKSSKASEQVSFNFSASTPITNFSIIVDGEYEMFNYELFIPMNTTHSDQVFLTFGFDVFSQPILVKATLNKKSEVKFLQHMSDWMETKGSMKESTQFLKEMERIMKNRYKLHERKNEHESIVFRLKERMEIDNTFISYLTKKEKKSISEALIKHNDWISNDQTKKEIKDYNDKIAELNKLVSEPETRLNNRNKVVSEMALLNNSIKEAELESTKSTNDTTKFNSKLIEIKKWYDERIKQIQSTPHNKNLKINQFQVEKKRTELSTSFNEYLESQKTPAEEKKNSTEL